MAEFTKARTARKGYPCDMHPYHSIAPGDRYLMVKVSPGDDDAGNYGNTWISVRVCARCVVTDRDLALLEGISEDELVARRQAEVDGWNAEHPVGTPVRYWTWTREGEGAESVTRSAAWLVSGTSAPGVLVEGKAGAIYLTHVERLDLTLAGEHRG